MQNIILVLSALVAVAFAGYVDRCGRDGFYYNDEKSFTICSNGNSYVQPCPPGSRNSGRYRKGYWSDSAHSFCDVNLVDHGYAARHGYYDNRHHGNSYTHRGHHGNSYGHHGNSYSYGHHDFGYGHHGNHRGHHSNSYGHHGNNRGGHGHGHFGHHGGFGHHGFDGHRGHYH